MHHTCLNCNTSYEGNFCPHCGQKAKTHRITFAAIMHDIPHSVFHVDKGLFYTFAQMLYKPGTVLKNYIDGKRVNYFSPFAYVFLLSAVSSFVTHAIQEQMSVHVSNKDMMLFPGMAMFFYHYPALMFCLLAPFISLWSWLFNLDFKYNYWENLVLNTYLIAQFNLIFILYVGAQAMHWYNSPNVTPVLLAFLAYVTFAYVQFFKRKMGGMRIVRNVLMFLFIALTLITGLSVFGFMTPWWNFYQPR